MSGSPAIISTAVVRVITVNSVAKVMANKTTEEKTKFDEVHIYLLKGEYPPRARNLSRKGLQDHQWPASLHWAYEEM